MLYRGEILCHTNHARLASMIFGEMLAILLKTKNFMRIYYSKKDF